MHEAGRPVSMASWLADVRAGFGLSAPELLPLFDTYTAEAIFGRRYIADDVNRLAPGAMILEVGAGSMLLSCQLVREGFQVTSLEPTGSGFSHFTRMRELILAKAAASGCTPRILEIGVESLAARNFFDYAFSVNVMEHVCDVEEAIVQVSRGLVVGAIYRFTCPNYIFPYEPHFNIPTLFSKKLTERFFWQKIHKSEGMADAVGTWMSLNWITVGQVRKICNRIGGLEVDFGRTLLVSMLERVASEPAFANRRSAVVQRMLLLWQ